MHARQVSPSPTLGYDAQILAPTNGFATMNEGAAAAERSEYQAIADDIFDVSDAALEAAASTAIPGGALSFPNAPTVSIIVICCSFD
jgi:hypothetical protein